MNSRCYDSKDKDYEHYGGRGIYICQQWIMIKNPKVSKSLATINREKVSAFMSWSLSVGWEKGLEIDRIDNNKGYSPDNCKWTTRRQNTINRNKMLNTTSKFRGVSFHKCSKKWACQVQACGKKYYVGVFNTELEAAQAFNTYILNNDLPQKLNDLGDCNDS